MLQLPAELFDAMIAHARQELPAECCGLLAGRGPCASRLFRLRNELDSPVAYSADPRDLFAAYRAMHEQTLEIVAIYHSHPTTEARPSRRDLAENYYGQVPRIIISLAAPSPVVKAFLLFDDRFQEIEFQLLSSFRGHSAMQRTLVILKPDCVQRRLTGRILARFEDKGLRLVAMKMLQMDRALAERLYSVHQGRDFYEPLLAFMTSSPSVALVIDGSSAIAVVRGMLGSTAGAEAAPGTIRGDFALSSRLNLVHASDSVDSAAREIAVLFDARELHEYELANGRWVVPPA